MKTFEFILENLNCAHCASVIEKKLQDREELLLVQFSFATKKLRLEPSNQFRKNYKDSYALSKDLTEFVQILVDSVEEGVYVRCISHKIEENYEQHYESSISKWSILEVLCGLLLLLVTATTTIISPKLEVYIILFVFIGISRYVFITAIKNARKGRIMDENFLMCIATIGAIGIGDYKEALGVMLFYRIGVMFEERATNQSRKEILDVLDMRPETVVLVEEGGIREIDAAIAQVGQVVQVRVGDRIPLDGTVVAGESRLDTSPVTGEPKPVSVSIGSAVLSGCINTTGVLQIRIDKPLTESFVSKVLNAVETASANKPIVDRFITKFARYYTPVVLGITAITMIVPSLITHEWSYWFYTGLTFLVISCPCALVLSVPLSFFAGMGGSSKLGILFKGGIAMESMKSVKVIAMDKTGTLTIGKFAVDSVEVISNYKEDEILQYCASSEVVSSHPIAHSICEKAEMQGISLLSHSNVQEYAGEGLVAVIDGKKVISGNRRLFARYSIDIPADLDGVKGASEVLVAIDGVYVGRIIIKDQLKNDAIASVRRLRKQGYEVVMVTGDSYASAIIVAKEAGISQVYADLLPQDKLNVIHTLREKYGSVMFIGDGINDAPVLAGANVGCAMGSGADAALEAADVVFMNSEVYSIERSIRMAKKTISVAWQNIWIALSIKSLVMILGFIGYASLWLAIFADTGVLIICVINAIRLLHIDNSLKVDQYKKGFTEALSYMD